MKRFSLLFILVLLVLPSFAQEAEQMPYEIALERIEEARVSGATALNLDNLGLTELPSEIAQLTTLEQLYVQYNFLDSLPPEIGNLSNLQFLYLDFNQLSSIPAEIGNLQNLRLLDFAYNQLDSLPAEIGNLTNLNTLGLAYNQFTELPLAIGNLNLCVLDLTHNQLTHVSGNLGQRILTGQNCDLRLNGNPLISPPQEVVEKGTVAILAYLRNEAWWHLQRLIAGGAGSLGLVAAIILGFRWKNRRGKEKEKRG